MKNRFVPILALAGVMMVAAACSPAASTAVPATAAPTTAPATVAPTTAPAVEATTEATAEATTASSDTTAEATEAATTEVTAEATTASAASSATKASATTAPTIAASTVTNVPATTAPTTAASSNTATGGIAQQAVADCTAVTDPNITMAANSNQQQFSAPQQVIDNSHTYCAIFKVDHGRFVVQLVPQNAPINVNNFVFLASKGFYDGMGFHRVISNFMAQTGDPTGTGGGGPGYDNIPLEGSGPLKYDKPGVVGVARTNDPNSAGSQFFITFVPFPSLDNQYTIIGFVASGMDVVNQIKIRDVDSDPNANNITPEKLISVRVVDIGAK